ncbi:MAG: hypothetical protein ACFFHD_06850, partial [Promethearchaeota archaeon]
RKIKNLKFFNEAAEYLDKFNTKDILLNEESIRNRSTTNYLRDEMLIELNNLRNILVKNPDLKIESLTKEEKKLFFEFIKFYRFCPICGIQNHYFNLKQIFFDKEKQNLKQELIRLMIYKKEKLKKSNINLGVLCCDCYKKIISE